MPIYIGATGMKMMELTGEIADGVVLNYLVSPDYNSRALDALERGASAAGRSVDDLDRPQLVVCSVHDDRATALDMARNMVTQYLGQQPHIMKASGVPDSLLEEVGKVLTWPATAEQVEAASRLVPDDIVQMLTASGTPAEGPRGPSTATLATGATCPILYPLGDVHAMIGRLRCLRRSLLTDPEQRCAQTGTAQYRRGDGTCRRRRAGRAAVAGFSRRGCAGTTTRCGCEWCFMSSDWCGRTTPLADRLRLVVDEPASVGCALGRIPGRVRGASLHP